ncbi:MAG: type II secretion system F family protein [Deltaproteobacteria bacterium]|nr:MAG: type II secretion system F family protein [Deltaproteobacteria bacterium]
MGNWKWEGLNKEGKRSSGMVEATSLRDARRALRAQGIRPRKLNSPSILEFDLAEWLVEQGLVAPFGNKELVIFTRQLSVMVNAGVPIIQALEIIFKSEKHPVLKRAVQSIAREVSEGKTINEAMEKQKGFSRLYINLVKAGETGGILDQILEKLAEHMEKQEKIKKQVKGALQYPMIVCIIGAGVIWALMVFVVPQFVEMLEGTGQKVPGITQFVIDVSDFLGNYSMYLVGGLVVAAFIFKVWVGTKVGKRSFDNFSMKLPLFGDLIIKGNLATFCRTLATMLGAGITLTEALEVCIETVDNTVIANDLSQVRDQVIQGKTFAEPLMEISYFPEMVASMVKVGEQTGNLDMMLPRSQMYLRMMWMK